MTQEQSLSLPSSFSSLGEHLRWHRLRLGLSQEALAESLNVSARSIRRWEQDQAIPQEVARERLCHVLGIDSLFGASSIEEPTAVTPSLWHMPFPRNPFFTGRDAILRKLHEALGHQHTAVLSQSSTLSGLGGIGKTQTALEYAYRYATNYSAVFWIRAETLESLLSSFASVADLLNLPEKQEHDQNRIVAAVTQWLTHQQGWLLIFDNIEDPELAKKFLPPARQGAMLLTSRRQALGITAQTLNLERMVPEEGLRFLLHRARRFDATTSLDQLALEKKKMAQTIVAAMDGLPLALDQAGAYIEATQCTLSDFLHLFSAFPRSLLAERDASADHPLSVAKTFTLAFEQLQRIHPLAAEMLTVCIFLAPEAIPESLFIEGASSLGSHMELITADPFAFSTALKALLAYSLIQRAPETKTLSIHRLVQTVLRNEMDELTRRQWATKVVCTVNRVFPEVDFSAWEQCQSYLSHVLACFALVKQENIITLDAARLLHQAGRYLYERARYPEAEPLYEKARELYEHLLGAEHPDSAPVLESQAELYEALWKDKQAELLYQRVLDIRGGSHSSEGPTLAFAESIIKAMSFYYKKGQYSQAEPLCRQAVEVFERLLGPEHIRVAESLNHLAMLYQEQGRFAEAEPHYQRALAIREHVLGSEHPDVATTLKTLGGLYHAQGYYAKAESFYIHALKIRERTLGAEHPHIAASLRNLGMLYQHQGKYDKVKPLYQRALAIRKRAFGTEHPLVGDILNTLAELYLVQGHYERARRSFMQARAIWEQSLEPHHPDLAHNLYGLAELAYKQGHYKEAGELCERVLDIRTKIFGTAHHEITPCFTLMAKLAVAQGQYEQAETLYIQALEILERSSLSHHPRNAAVLADMARLYQTKGNDQEALTYARRALAIQEQMLRMQHPDTAETLILLEELSHAQKVR